MNMKKMLIRQMLYRQRGMTMIVALIMLLLLTLIGVAGMRDNQLQEKMAGGTEDRDTAFQAAEAALRAGEGEISSTGTYNGGCTPGTCYIDYSTAVPAYAPSRLCGGVACTESAYWQQYAWTTSTNSKVYAVSTSLTEVGAQPRYVVEKLPSTFSAISGTINDGASAGTGVVTITDFLITARGTGRTSDAVVILQSMYRTHNP
jgi:type IV pilus assembly protein PilX